MNEIEARNRLVELQIAREEAEIEKVKAETMVMLKANGIKSVPQADKE